MVQLYPIAVGGLTPFSTVDFPGHLSAVVFCLGCPWRCAYCHNPHLQTVDSSAAEKRWPEVVDWLMSRRGLIDSVVFSGGEPLLQRGLAGAMWQVRSLGYGVGLHTAGIYPERLAGILPLVDWIGFDVKAPFCDYARITGAKSGNAAQRSLSLLLASGKPCEVRCTADESLLSPDDARRMAEQLAGMGVRRLVLQSVRNAAGVSRQISPTFVRTVEDAITDVELR
jgi:pyruvate formate lyase activating enzyme